MRIIIPEKLAEEILQGKRVIVKKEFRLPENIKPGTLVDIYDEKGNFICKASANPYSNIVLRVISFEKDFDIKELFLERLKKAKKFRERFYKGTYRWVYSEADFLSGLIVDKYNDIVVFQNSNPFFEKYKRELVEAILEIEDIEAIYEKDKYRSRVLEGLKEVEKFWYGNKEETIIEEGKARFYVNVVLGQKTGFFLDQRENRIFFEGIAEGKVLDVFAYTGGFGIHAALNPNVEKVVFIEKDEKATYYIKKNAELNDVKDKIEIIEGDAFKILPKLVDKGEKFDVVNLDPAGLAVSGVPKAKAMKSLYIINSFAIKLIKEGYLVTSDCSYYIHLEEFKELIFKAIRYNKKEGKLFHIGRQAFDHPVVSFHKELEYLKTLYIYIN